MMRRPAIPPFNNAKLRRAILTLVDQDQTLRALMSMTPRSTPTVPRSTCDLLYFTDAGWPADVAKAKELVKESGL